MRNEKKNVFASISSKFISFPDEEVILVQRKHWSTFVFYIISSIFLLASFLIFSIITSGFIPTAIPLLLMGFTFFSIFIITSVLQTVIDWYFNLYIITNKKITEISYKPMSSKQINAVLLDQVRCTEIDTRIGGFVNELLDVGDVIITFDRPTHQEEFRLQNIENPKDVENILQRSFIPAIPDTKHQEGRYTKNRLDPEKWIYIEDINNSNRGGGEKLWN